MAGVDAAPNRKRLKSYNHQRGTRTGMSVVGAFVFGSVFVMAGVAIALVGLRVILVDPSSIHAPHWVIVVSGACFAAAGLMVWTMAATQHRAERHRRDAMRLHVGSDAHADHAWSPSGFVPPRWGKAIRSIVLAVFISVFLSMFNWWAWCVPGSPWPLKVIVVLFDLVLLLVWWQAVLVTGRAVKFGGSRLVFQRFPYRLDDTIAVRWIPPSGVTRAERGSFTFRCIEEYYEERGRGKDRNRWLVHDELCAEVQSFDTPTDFPPGRPVELRFALPTDARATRLSAERPIYWELEVRLAMAGLDFEEWYLVPVYSR